MGSSSFHSDHASSSLEWKNAINSMCVQKQNKPCKDTKKWLETVGICRVLYGKRYLAPELFITMSNEPQNRLLCGPFRVTRQYYKYCTLYETKAAKNFLRFSWYLHCSVKDNFPFASISYSSSWRRSASMPSANAWDSIAFVTSPLLSCSSAFLPNEWAKFSGLERCLSTTTPLISMTVDTGLRMPWFQD